MRLEAEQFGDLLEDQYEQEARERQYDRQQGREYADAVDVLQWRLGCLAGNLEIAAALCRAFEQGQDCENFPPPWSNGGIGRAPWVPGCGKASP